MNTSEELPERDLFGARPGEIELPAQATATTCANCGAAIAWVTTRKGNHMPLALATLEERDGARYAMPHWEDCPDADQWRRSK